MCYFYVRCPPVAAPLCAIVYKDAACGGSSLTVDQGERKRSDDKHIFHSAVSGYKTLC